MRRYYPRLSVIIKWERFLVFSPFFYFCDEARHWWQADTDRGCSVFRCRYKYKYEYKYKWKYKYKHNYKRSTAVTSRHRSRLVSVQAQGTKSWTCHDRNIPNKLEIYHWGEILFKRAFYQTRVWSQLTVLNTCSPVAMTSQAQSKL